MKGIIALVGLVLAGTAWPAGQTQGAATPLTTPAGPGSGIYNLSTGADGRAYLAWLEPAGEGVQALRFSRLTGGAWEPPREVARSASWFVNWADHPSVTATTDGRLFAHWLAYTGRKQGSYGYSIHVETSGDSGRTWTPVFDEGTANITDYSGFLTFLPSGRDIRATFLTPLAPDEEGGHDHEADHIKTLGMVSFGRDGFPVRRQVVDTNTCSCCSTDMATTSAGPIAVYRDRDAGEVRDISIVRLLNGAWTTPRPVHRDGWVIKGCPTNGPAVAAVGTRVAVAWFTGAGDRPLVRAAFSTDAGASFSSPVRVDDGNPVGWPDVVMLKDGRTFVSWLERTGGGNGELRVRQIAAGAVGASRAVADAAAGRTTGIPMMVSTPQGLLVAWRREAVRTALVKVDAVPRP